MYDHDEDGKSHTVCVNYVQMNINSKYKIINMDSCTENYVHAVLLFIYHYAMFVFFAMVQTGGCQSFFRNLEDHPAYARITYWKDLMVLKVELSITASETFTECFVLNDIEYTTGK